MINTDFITKQKSTIGTQHNSVYSNTELWYRNTHNNIYFPFCWCEIEIEHRFFS